MKLGYIALLVALGAAPVFAAGEAAAAKQGAAALVEGRGQVNAVDASAGTVNISHEPIGALGWPAMTMDFTLEQKVLAAKLKPGQRVKFRLKPVGDGDYVVSAIEAAR